MQFPVTPTPTPAAYSGEQVTDVINAIDRTANTFQDFTFGIAVLFVVGLAVLAIIAYFYFNRNASKGAQTMLTTFAEAMGTTLKEREERIDKLEAKEAEQEERQNEGMMAVGDGLNRIADLWLAQQKREVERDRILSDATSAMTAIATVGSKPLQQVVKDMADLHQADTDIRQAISRLYDRFSLIFPSDKPIRDLMIEAVREVSERKKTDSQEIKVMISSEAPPIPDALPPTGTDG